MAYDLSILGGDFTLDPSLKKIQHAAGTTRYTVNAFYSALMDLFDELTQLDDDVPMKANTPTEYELINGWTFLADADLGYLYGGSIKVGSTETWANFYTLGSITASAVVYIEQNGALIAAYPGYATGHIDQLVKVRSASADIDSRYITVYVRNLGDLYDHFKIQAPDTGGRNPVPLASAADTNDDSSGASVAGVTVTFGAATYDLNQDGTNENYSVTVNGGGNSLLNVYRYLKYVTRRQNTADLYGTVDGRFYRGITGYTELKAAPFGSFAGGKFFGAQGVLVTNVSDPNNLQLKSNEGVDYTPPQSISVVVSGVVSGDRVFVARSSGGLVNKAQFTIASRTTTTVTVNQVVSNDIPTSGVLRVGDDRYAYTTLNRATKTFGGMTAVAAYAGGTACYVPLIDEQAVGTSVAKSFTYVSDFDVIARVRKKGILPFENTATVGTAGASISAIRTTDTVVT